MKNLLKENWLTALITFLVLVYLLVLFTGTKVLVYETKVEVGADYYVEEYGNLGDADQASLVCKYFNGRRVLTDVYWYSPNDILGKQTCPFLTRQ